MLFSSSLYLSRQPLFSVTSTNAKFRRISVFCDYLLIALGLDIIYEFFSAIAKKYGLNNCETSLRHTPPIKIKSEK